MNEPSDLNESRGRSGMTQETTRPRAVDRGTFLEAWSYPPARRELSYNQCVRHWLAAFILAPGCVPFVVPPSQVSVAGGAVSDVPPEWRQIRRQDVTGYETTETAPIDGRSLGVFQASLRPLQLFPDLKARRFDFGVGYGMEKLQMLSSPLHGGFVQVDGYPLMHVSGNAVGRVGVRAGFDALYAGPVAGVGAGGTLAVVAESDAFIPGQGVSGGSGDGAIAALVDGEVGLGAYLGVSYRRFHDGAYWFPSLGVYGRVPAAAGVLCCLH